MIVRRFSTLAVVATLLLAGCGDDDSDVATDEAAETGDQMADGMGDMGDHDDAAKAEDADRVVEVRMVDGRRFEPETIDVKKGETITFKLVNEDDVFHQFVLGDEEAQASYDEEMKAMGDEPMDMDDEANVRTLEGGETKELDWTFEEAGTVVYGCHQPGHYEAGMKGTITVS